MRFALAQLTSRPGKEDLLSRILTGDDLPGHWKTVDERTWLTGRTGPSTPWSRRARTAGSISAWRSLHDGADRWAWAQVVPLASVSDAGTALAEVGRRILGNPRAEVRIVREQDIRLAPFAGASAVWAHEQHTRPVAKPGTDGVSLLAGAVGRYVVVLGLSGTPAWDWRSASGLAARQTALLTDETG